MTIPPSLSLLTFFLVACSAAAVDPPSVAPAAAPTPSTAANASEFIRTSCETTLYPELCYHSLAGYANAVQQDPGRLARVAIGVSLSRATRMTIYLANVSRQVDYGADHREAVALHDCFTVFGDAVDQIRGSLKQMRQLTGTGEELRFQMSNVQTWMSAALTNEDTCVDGFEDVGDGPVKMDVCDRTVKVKEVTSNALALVNSYVAKVMAP
ncbi:21 kDa protein-like [Sesamum indicum]|uniref:21 kDa protein-like n=1 Tax=Sesamum indicum TaxID=4182 RepID=A0A6I9SL53_SESIN|nr:21 kDa protein-like [Sesamum indicum]